MLYEITAIGLLTNLVVWLSMGTAIAYFITKAN